MTPDPDPYYWVGAPTQRRRMKMPATSPTKAILAAVLAALVSLVTALQDRTSIESMKAFDWILVLLAAAVSGITVYLVPNTATGTRRRGDIGQTNIIGAVIGVLLVVILVVLILRLA